MSELVEGWPAGFKIIGFDELQGYADRDIILLGSAELDLLRHHWERYLAEPDGTRPDHPDEFIKFLACSIKATGDPDSYDLAILISMRTRFHLAAVKLPRSKFVTCVYNWNYYKRPYLIVTQDWFDEILRTQFSLYGLVDAIGMRQLLSAQGHVTRQQITALRDGIDALANAHSDHAFLTFADSVIVKTNWLMIGDSFYEGTYNPERFLRILESVRGVVRAALSLDSYAVVTQGANLAAEDGLMSLSQGRNHVFFGSLGTPFAQLVEMDASIRDALRERRHGPKQFYLAHWLVLSLHWKSYDTREELRKSVHSFDSKLSTPEECSYLAIDAGELFSLITERD